MQFLFVSRRDYDAACREIRGLEDRVVEWRTQSDAWRHLYDDQKALLSDVLEKYHALRLAGAAIPEQPRHEEPEMPPEILMRAIREVSPTQDHAYHMNYQWAMSLKDHWTDEGQMREAAQKIRYGSDYTPLEGDA